MNFMAKIYILGLGPGNLDSLTMGVVNRINSGNRNYLRTENHPTLEYFKDNTIAYESYDHIYEEEEDFKKVYEHIAGDLIEKAKEHGEINYLVPGNPLVAEMAVEILLKREPKEVEIEIISGISFIEPIIETMKRDPINGLKILDGTVFNINDIDINLDCIIAQVYNMRIATDIKLSLSEVYGDEYEIYLIDSAGIKAREKVLKIPIYELDRVEKVGHLTSLYIPRLEKEKKVVYNINDVMKTLEILRSDEGCPWDKKQSYESMRECIIEEAYEVVDAIDVGEIDGLVEELGDLLLQVLFYGQIGLENGEFNFHHITTALNKKLIYRHPHVFSREKLAKSDEMMYNWDKLKFKDRNIESHTDRLKDLPKLPSLMASYKIQQRASKAGFDWDSVDGALDKVSEEYHEVIEAMDHMKGGDVGEVEEELGDLLFAVVNVSRFFNINPEVALNKTINKFITRFEFVETKAREMGNNLEDMTLEEIDKLWDQAKLHRGK